MTLTIMLAYAAATAPAGEAPNNAAGEAALTTLVLLAVIVGWFSLRGMVRSLRARKTEAAVGGRFGEFALYALTNAARLDGRVSDAERVAIADALSDMPGAATDPAAVGRGLETARLSKDELVAYLAARAQVFTQDQKVALLKALLAVFAADGRFDESEHAALIDYTAAMGFDRQSAPDMLRGFARDFQRGSIT